MRRWLIALCAAIGYAALLFPSAGAWLTDWQQTTQLHDYQAVVATSNQEVINEQLRRAAAYNQKLAEGNQAVLPDESDDQEYSSLLAVPGKSIIGQVGITRLGIELPIYHGTSDTALSVGAGHLYGTSLPIGGPSTHTVLTAHSGMTIGSGFDALHEARIGDVITIRVLGRSLAYRVREINVVAPTDTHVLDISTGQDLITLITCTPIGINSHRLLVTGERIPAAPDTPQLVRTSQVRTPPWWLVIWSFATATTTWLASVLVRPIAKHYQKGKHVDQSQIPHGHHRRRRIVDRPGWSREIRTEFAGARRSGHRNAWNAFSPPIHAESSEQSNQQGPATYRPRWYPVRG